MIRVVSGFGRCGSSLTMQMLQRCGVPVYGTWPAYEDMPGEYPMRHPDEWRSLVEGLVFKCIDPTIFPVPAGPEYRVVWLDRDPKQQAKSALKMAANGGAPIDPNDRVAQGKMARSYIKDRPRALSFWKGRGASILTLRFEDLITDTDAAVAELAEHFGVDLDPAVARRSLFPRDTDCLPYLLETFMVHAADVADQLLAAR